MRVFYLPILLLSVSLAVSIFLYFSPDDFNIYRPGWIYKEVEIKSRLLSLPIILYHNIDGNGEFSIDYEALKSHFFFFKDRKIKVIPLDQLIQKLENPGPFIENALVITFDDGFYSMHSKLQTLAKEFKYPVTLFVYADFIKPAGSGILTWNLLRAMDSEGIDIQCHSISHLDLTKFSQKDDIESKKMLFDEIYLSKRIIELYLRKKISYFAFPFGRYDLKTVDLAVNAGYRRVFSTDYGHNIITRDNFCLRRHHVKKAYSLDYIEKIIK